MLTRYGEHNLTWVDLVAPTHEEVRSLVRDFDLDSLIAQELLVPSFKHKVERRGDAVYVILHFPALQNGIAGRAEQEIDFVIGKHFLITARYEESAPLHSFAKAFEVQSVLKHNAGITHGGHLFVSMVRTLYQAMSEECDTIARRLQEIEESIFNGREKRMVVELSHVGKTIHDFRQALIPHKEMLSSMEPASARFFGPEFSYYLHSLIGSCARVGETLEHLRDSMIELRETNNSLLTTKQNDVMKTLTVLTFLFLPLTFIASLFAMDAHAEPIVGHPLDFWIIVGGMGGIALACLLYFKHKGWL